MSKWFTPYGVLMLADKGKIDLDEPVSNYLTRWHLPPSKLDNSKVTVRRLLSHTAGLTDGLGFGDLDNAAPSLYVDGKTAPYYQYALGAGANLFCNIRFIAEQIVWADAQPRS